MWSSTKDTNMPQTGPHTTDQPCKSSSSMEEESTNNIQEKPETLKSKSNKKKKKKVTRKQRQNQWRCDICSVATFSSLEAATAHEILCKEQLQLGKSHESNETTTTPDSSSVSEAPVSTTTLPLTNQASAEEAEATTEVDTSTSSSSQSSSSNVPNTVSPVKTESQTTESAEESKPRRQLLHSSEASTEKKESVQAASFTGDEATVTDTAARLEVDTAPETDNGSKDEKQQPSKVCSSSSQSQPSRKSPRSKMAREVSPDSAPRLAKKKKLTPDENDDTSTTTNTNNTNNKATASSKASMHSFFAPRKSTKRSTAGNNNNKTSSTSDKKPVHAFFAQSSSRAKKTKRTDTEQESVASLHVPIVAVQNPKATAKQKDGSKKSTLKAAEETANALAAMINAQITAPSSTPAAKSKPKLPLAGIFANKSMKQLVAEQRQAEFLAKRHTKRQKELERQQRRAAAALKDIDNAGDSHSSTASTTAPKTLPAHMRLPMAPRFPTPNHIVPASHMVTAQSPPAKSSSCTGATSPTQPDSSLQPLLQEKDLAPCPLYSSPSDLDTAEEGRDLMEEAFANALLPSVRPEGSQTHKDLWIDRYGLHTTMEHAVGEKTLQAAEMLKAWIKDWCAARQGALERMKERQKKLKSKSKRTTKKTSNYKNDDEDYMDESMRGMDSVYLLTGPAGSGKTALVHAVAKACQCPVLEINTTKARSGSALKHSIQEATQSCSTSDLFQQQNRQKQEQKQTKASKRRFFMESDSDSELDSTKPRPAKDVKKGPSLTVILIDEVDLIYESNGDAGFWAALLAVARTALCPIFLTSTTAPPFLSPLNHRHLSLTRPTPSECATKISSICEAEGVPRRNQESLRELEWIASVLQCDMRRIIHQLQVYVQTQANRPVHALLQSPEPTLPLTTEVCSESLQRPVFQAIRPSSIPSDKYSTVTLHGKHFQSLVASFGRREFTVQFSRTIVFQARVLDDNRVLLLCPPCADQRVCSRINSLTVESPFFGRLDTSSIQAEQLLDGALLLGQRTLTLTYMTPNNDPGTDSEEEEEAEFDAIKSEAPESLDTARLPTPDVGQELWKKALTEEDEDKTLDSVERPKVSPEKDLLETLEDYASFTELQSDAAFLEDWQGAVPELAGACRGFAFDFTEEGTPMDDGKLKLNDNCRPPSEDRLYSSGWKDNCFFFGTPETYMTRPSTRREQRFWKDMMESSRGERSYTSFEIADRDEEAANETDEIVLKKSTIDEEDMFFPQNLPPLLQSLPNILRQARRPTDYFDSWTKDQVLEQRQEATKENVTRWIHAVSDCSHRPKHIPPSQTAQLLWMSTSQNSLRGLDATVFTDFVPLLGYMGATEEALDSLERSEDQGLGLRSSRSSNSRRRARNARKHHFDRISRTLQLDEGALSTTDIGQAMARHLLTYQRAQTKQSNASRPN